jgi:DNA-binding transcriptional LysR family regulator
MSTPDDLNLRRIRYFLALGAEPHFRRAAEQLRITQPVLSRQIRLLADELGVELLHRGPPVALTEAGRLFMKQGPALLGDVAALARDRAGRLPSRSGSPAEPARPRCSAPSARPRRPSNS